MRSTRDYRIFDPEADNPSPRLTLLRMGFTQPPESPRALVRSYRTVSTLPVIVSDPSAVCFLWHCPAGHPDWPLASILSYGAPTFLSQLTPTAVTRLTHPARLPYQALSVAWRVDLRVPGLAAPYVVGGQGTGHPGGEGQ